MSLISKKLAGFKSDDYLDCALIFLAVLYTYSRVWVHQDDYATGLQPQSPLPYFVALVYVIFFIRKCFVLIKRDAQLFLQLNKIICVGVCMVLSVAYYLLVGDYSLLLAVSLGIALQDKNAKFIMTTTGAFSLIFLLIQLLGYYSGFFYDIISNHRDPLTRDLGAGNQVRVAFGFGHPNRPFSFLLPVWLSTYYLSGRLKLALVVVCSVLSVFLFFTTGSRTMLIVIPVILLALFFLSKIKISKLAKWLIYNAYPIFTTISYIAVYTIGFPENPINKLLSGRPQWWGYYVSNGVGIVGPSDGASLVFASGLPLDNFFLDVIYRGGVLLALAMAVWYLIFVWVALKKGDKPTIFSMLILFVYGLSESAIRFVTAPYLPLMMIYLLSFIDARSKLSNERF